MTLGYLDAAVQLSQEVASRRTEVLGAGHPDILRSLLNMAMTYAVAGHVAECVEPAEPLIQDCRAEFGPDAGICLHRLSGRRTLRRGDRRRNIPVRPTGRNSP
ncbi:tetratricopeptide repeat protein [Streptomyces minutiscleroticus]|uniref:Tetratricopeptide repeat protein n=1 Tax=Streptomyces minutiscleroticus TaxID=68238 RepID=A0A918NMS4_9ACTN|nr:hypothetical protein GCM10010358_39880 [Streptomyces minutiscleroticus]